MAEEIKYPTIPPASQASVEFVVPDPKSGLLTTYANNVQVGWTFFDVRLLFGEVVESTQEKITIEQRAQITISYLQAKILVGMLTQAISQHESVFGEVKLPGDLSTLNITSSSAVVPPSNLTRK